QAVVIVWITPADESRGDAIDPAARRQVADGEAEGFLERAERFILPRMQTVDDLLDAAGALAGLHESEDETDGRIAGERLGGDVDFVEVRGFLNAESR